jgi:hypothetical protein
MTESKESAKMTTGKQITADGANTTPDTNLQHARPLVQTGTAGIKKVRLLKRSKFSPPKRPSKQHPN